MAKKVQEWVETDVRPFRDKPISWISPYHYRRQPRLILQIADYDVDCMNPLKLKQNQPSRKVSVESPSEP